MNIGSQGISSTPQSLDRLTQFLHDLAQAVSATGLNIRWAKAVTVDGMAIDTFHVVDADGGPVHDDGVIGHLAMRMREIR